jgi:hypothetical protein
MYRKAKKEMRRNKKKGDEGQEVGRKGGRRDEGK